MDSGETYDQLSARLAHEHPELTRGRIEGIVVDEHDLIIGLKPGDIVPALVVAAVVERVEREVARLRGGDGPSPAVELG